MIRFNTMAECKQIVKEIRYVVSAVRHVGKGMGILDIVVPSTMGRLGEDQVFTLPHSIRSLPYCRLQQVVAVAGVAVLVVQ